jgi:hypothetical protein
MGAAIGFVGADGKGRTVSTDNPLPVQVVSGSPGGGDGGGAVTVADGADVAQGATTQAAAAAAGTGNYTLLQAAKRVLLNWADLLERIPALVSGRVPVNIQAYEPVGEKLLVGTSRDILFDSFNTWDTTNTWEVVQVGSGMEISGPLGGAAAGSSPYINISSGTTAGKTVILSRASFRPPFELRYQITASQRITNNRLLVGFVQVNDAGAIVTDTTYATADEVLNARNAVFHQHDGTVATNAQLRARAAGSALDTFANAFGGGFTTNATGTTPNFIAVTSYGLTVEREKISSRAYGQNATTNAGGQFSYDRTNINPATKYKLCIIAENNDIPASSTDWRLHLINLIDAVRVDIGPRNSGSTDQSRAFPVVASIVTGTLANVTTSGTPAAPATPYILNSAATTNGALVLTGTSGLHAFYATNTGATPAYVKLYNKATAPTVGTDVPAMVLPVPAAVSGVPGAATLPIGHNGFRFALGLGIAVTGGAADTDTTAVAAGQVKVMLSRTV